MATILPFIIRRGPPRAKPVDASASVIIFPGVRYERPAGDAGQKNSSGSPRKRKRKTS